MQVLVRAKRSPRLVHDEPEMGRAAFDAVCHGYMFGLLHPMVQALRYSFIGPTIGRGGRWMPNGMRDTEVAMNLKAPILRVSHARLTRCSDDSPFRSNCPICHKGALRVGRNHLNFQLVRYDRCSFCAQRFWYTDDSIAGETFQPGELPKALEN